MKKILVCGAGGFIAHHLAKRLVKEGNWVRGVDLKTPLFSKTACQDFKILDLREHNNCQKALTIDGGFDEVYQLAADMGGMGFIHNAELNIIRNNVLINVNMIHEAAESKVKKYFFSSSVCIYRDMKPGEGELTEEEAYPAMPDNEYGWEKLYSERVLLTYARHCPIEARIARFQNCYGPEGTWEGGREKAPAAICRKVAEAKDGGEVEVWGNGSAIRSYTYIDDMVDGILRLVNSEIKTPVNIGNPEYVSVDELVNCAIEISGKKLSIKHVEGPVGVQSRNFSNAKIYSLGWKSNFPLKKGLKITYDWILEQVEKKQKSQTKK